MPDRSFILFAGPLSWRVATWPATAPPIVDIPCAVTPSDTVNALAMAMKSIGYSGQPIAIGVPSAWCLSTSISMQGLSRNDSKAMLYRLEENLPIAAEAVAADFVVSGELALGACVRLDLIEPFATALESAGVAVQSIFPTALATVQGLANLPPHCTLLCCEIGTADSNQLNVIQINDSIPATWALVPAMTSDLQQQLNFLSIQSTTSGDILQVGLEPKLIADLNVDVKTIAGVNALDSAMKFAAETLRGHVNPWIEFRRGSLAIDDRFRLHRRWVNIGLAAAIALFVSLAAVLLFRVYRYQQLEAANANEMTSAFHEHFPGWETPVNIRAVVDAQYRRSQGNGSNLPADQRRDSALATLHDVLIPVMTQDHVQITRMAFHEHSFEIAGRLQSFDQVDVLAKLAHGSGLSVTPAQTHREADGSWSFVLQGSKTAEGHSS